MSGVFDWMARQALEHRAAPPVEPPGHDQFEGFLSPSDAATVMGVTVAEVHQLAQTGRLEWKQRGRSGVVIRPAILT